MTLPLYGVTVVSFRQAAPAPFATRQLADLGARVLQYEAGLRSVTGDAEPARVGISVASICAGMYLYPGVFTALLRRGHSGEGATLEVSMLEAPGEWMSQALHYAVGSGSQPLRSGPRHASIAPYGPYITTDGTIFLAIQNNREWALLRSEVLGDAELADDPHFAHNVERVTNRSELDRIIAAITCQSSVAAGGELLDGAGIANARMRDMLEFTTHPQLTARRTVANHRAAGRSHHRGARPAGHHDRRRMGAGRRACLGRAHRRRPCRDRHRHPQPMSHRSSY
ncbi:CoA transferase (plasmid) [Nocardioides sp. R1-1]|uniref:CoA transferase n=1 Tax=Nocardioides sp. R1-1 TaxID=3383502 RepID=UPI0038D17AD0